MSSNTNGAGQEPVIIQNHGGELTPEQIAEIRERYEPGREIIVMTVTPATKQMTAQSIEPAPPAPPFPITEESIDAATPEQLDLLAAELMGWRWFTRLEQDPVTRLWTVGKGRVLLDPDTVTVYRRPPIDPQWAEIYVPHVPDATDYDRDGPFPAPTRDPYFTFALLARIITEGGELYISGDQSHTNAEIVYSYDSHDEAYGSTGHAAAHERLDDSDAEIRLAITRAACLWGWRMKLFTPRYAEITPPAPSESGSPEQ